jgi:hypothetical protein
MTIELSATARKMDQPLERLPPDGTVSPSPYRTFSRDEWARLRADTPLTLTAEDVLRLQSLNDPVSLDEVVEIYLPLSRLLSLYVAATQGLFKATQRFLLAENEGKSPYIIGLAGSVAVGKSSTARLLKALLARWPNTPKVDLITTDGFLLPNAELTRLGLMERKGFPESYDTGALLRFLAEIKAGGRNVRAPLYSHLVYDVLPGEETVVDSPDILIVAAPEGRHRYSVRIRLLRFLDLHRCRRGGSAALVREPLPRAPPHSVPRPQVLLPPLCGTLGGGRHRDGRGPLAQDQSPESAGEHCPDPPARRAHLAQGSKPSDRRGGTAPPVTRCVITTIS